MQSNNRRKFIKSAVALGGVAAGIPKLASAASNSATLLNKVGDGFTFLFQGDSITDGNRTRNTDWNHVMGHGYQYLIASKLWYDFPAKDFHFFNRGISGNKVTDLTARWQKDTLEIKPDLLSILIGINDTSAFINGNTNYDTVHYEQEYRSLLQQTRQQLPNLQLVLCEPFVLPVGNVNEKWDAYATEVQKRSEIVRQLSRDFDAIFVSFGAAFNKALSRAPAAYWIWDGIHPMPAGHELMAREWLQQVSKKLTIIR